MTGLELADQTPGGLVSGDEFDRIVTIAERIARTDLVPRQYRNRPDDIIAAAIMGAEVGFGIMTSLRYIYVIDGKPEYSTEAFLALVRRAGHSVTGTVSSTKATVTGIRRDNGDRITVDYTIDDAKAAGLLGKGNWKKHTTDMLWARAVSALRRRLFPDVALGGYTLGELSGADSWEPGETRIVDAETGEIVEPGEPVYADPEQVDRVRAIIKQLDASTVDELREFARVNGIPPLSRGLVPADALDLLFDEVRRLAELADNGPDRYDDNQDYDPDGEPF